MQKNRSGVSGIANYFVQGFSLLNRNLDLYLIAALFTLASFLTQYLSKLLPLGLVIGVLSVIITVLSLSYSLTLAFFLSYKEQDKSLDYNFLWKMILQNAKRLIVPIIILTPIIILAFIILGIVLFKQLDFKNPQEFTQVLGINQPGWSLRYVLSTAVFNIMFSFLTFTSVFFSMEKLGIFSAWKESIVFSLKNMNFVALVIAISVTTNFITSFINLIPFNRTLIPYLILLPTQYVNLGVIASSLLFYQHSKKQ